MKKEMPPKLGTIWVCELRSLRFSNKRRTLTTLMMTGVSK
jgi:hypothetical protein